MTIANFQGGTGAFNIIAETAVLTGTVRAFKRETRDLLHKRVTEICEGVAKALGGSADVSIYDGYDPTINSAPETAFALQAAADIVGQANVSDNVDMCMGAEDFGAYLAEKPGAFIFVGQGVKEKNSPHNFGLHNPHYDFNDEIIPVGISWFAKLVERHMPL